MDWLADRVPEWMFVIIVMVLLILAFIIVMVGINVANSAWNCHAWEELTQEQTKIVAGSCMVLNPATQGWEVYSSRIRRTHLNLLEPAE